MLDDAVPVRRIGELEAEDLRVLLGLLQPVAGLCIDGFCLNHRNRKIAPVPQEVVETLLWPPFHLAAGDHDAAVGETLLFADLLVCPSRRVELRQDVASASVRFGKKGHFCWWLLLGRDNSRPPSRRHWHFHPIPNPGIPEKPTPEKASIPLPSVRNQKQRRTQESQRRQIREEF